MAQSAADFRDNAAHCRRLANGMDDPCYKQALIEMAETFESEANRLDETAD